MDIAHDYLNYGSPELRAAAEEWAAMNGYYVHRTGRYSTVAGGTF